MHGPRYSFTLIELLVVVAIIAVLISILVPSLHEAREMAMIATCGTRLRGLGLSLTVYAEDHEVVTGREPALGGWPRRVDRCVQWPMAAPPRAFQL